MTNMKGTVYRILDLRTIDMHRDTAFKLSAGFRRRVDVAIRGSVGRAKGFVK